MKANYSFAIRAALVLAGGILFRAQADQPIDLGPPEVIHHRLNPRFEYSPPKGTVTATSPIIYHGGAVLATPTVYVIWYGNWNQNNASDTAGGQQIIRDFLFAIGGSPYFDINTSYSTTATAITGNVAFGGEASDSGSQGKKLTDSRVSTIVQNAIKNRSLPSDANGIYFVLTSSDISESSGFCTRYCGWHTRATVSGKDIKFAFVGNAARCLNACSVQLTSPNSNPGVDAMISVIAHELEEATTDPDLNAWYDSSGAENADKCAWTFGQILYQTANGAYANMHIGSRDYLIQRQLYHSASGDFCATAVSVGSDGTITLSQ